MEFMQDFSIYGTIFMVGFQAVIGLYKVISAHLVKNRERKSNK